MFCTFEKLCGNICLYKNFQKNTIIWSRTLLSIPQVVVWSNNEANCRWYFWMLSCLFPLPGLVTWYGCLFQTGAWLVFPLMLCGVLSHVLGESLGVPLSFTLCCSEGLLQASVKPFYFCIWSWIVRWWTYVHLIPRVEKVPNSCTTNCLPFSVKTST